MTRWIVRSVYPQILPVLALSLLGAHCFQQTEQHTEANRTVRFINCTMTFRIEGPGVRTKASSLLPIKKLFTISCVQWMVAHRLMREHQACPDNTTMRKVKWISGSRFMWIQLTYVDWNVSWTTKVRWFQFIWISLTVQLYIIIFCISYTLSISYKCN